MTRTTQMEVAINAAVQEARTRLNGVRVNLYECGGYSTRESAALHPGEVTEHKVPCTGHARHAHTAPTEPPTSSQTEALAQTIAAAADQYRGLDTIGPTPQDIAAAKAITDTYYLVPRSEFPDVNPGLSGTTIGRYHFAGPHDRDLTLIRHDVASHAAWADYLEREQAEQAAAKAVEDAAATAARKARREELFLEFSRGTFIATTHKALTRAIDHILDTEEAAADGN